MIRTGSPARIAVVIWHAKVGSSDGSGAFRCAPMISSRPCGSLQLSAAVIVGPDPELDEQPAAANAPAARHTAAAASFLRHFMVIPAIGECGPEGRGPLPRLIER